jgi:hypothetical protein
MHRGQSHDRTDQEGKEHRPQTLTRQNSTLHPALPPPLGFLPYRVDRLGQGIFFRFAQLFCAFPGGGPYTSTQAHPHVGFRSFLSSHCAAIESVCSCIPVP